MPVSVFDLPRDANGLIDGEWRLYHVDAGFTAQLGPAKFVDGATIEPLSGMVLQRMLIAFGARLESAQRWEEKEKRRPKPEPKPPAKPFSNRLPWPGKTKPPTVEVIRGPRGLQVRQSGFVHPDLREVASADPDPPDEENRTVLPPGEQDDLAEKDRDQLRAVADAAGIDYDNRWGAPRLRDVIREQRSSA